MACDTHASCSVLLADAHSPCGQLSDLWLCMLAAHISDDS